MKRNLLILAIILLIGFIVNSCGDDEKKSSCECNPKQHNEGETCCTGNGCNCTIILKCICPADTLHLIGENCRGPLNCECELNVPGARASNGVAITNRHGVDSAVFAEMVSKVNTALAHAQLSSEDRQNFIKNNLKEIEIIGGVQIDVTAPVDGVFVVHTDWSANSIRGGLRDWCEEKGIE